MSIKIKNKCVDRAIVVCVLTAALVCFLQYMSVDLSAGVPLSEFLGRSAKRHLFGCGLMPALTGLVMLFTGRLAVSCLASSVFWAAYSFFNHYVTVCHGQPFSLTMIAQAGTALDVAGGYGFSADGTAAAIAVILVLNLGLCLCIKRAAKRDARLRNARLLRKYGLCCAVLLTLAVGVRVYKKTWEGYIWSVAPWLRDQGYIVWALTDSYWGFQLPLRRPSGYSADEVRKLAAVKTRAVRPEKLPDIVLILNEALYDLRRYTNLETDVPYLANWHAAPNAFRGYAVTPYAFGGTNDTEMELLTSHPAYLMARRAPTTWMDMDGVHSVAKYLGSLGYRTWAAHARAPMNYKRVIAWPALGFEHTRFEADFSAHEKYGNREETDAANYRDMIRWYEGASEEPRFFFLLTYQNHGGYLQNDDSLDTVHSLTDFGRQTTRVNEYLTSVRMSDEALRDLMAYFEGSDRPALVCVAGDHAPNIAGSLPESSEAEKSAGLAEREVPLLIWANSAFGPLHVESAPTVSMTDVVPLLLRAAGLPLSPYYEYLLDMARDIPIRERDGTYIRADGTKGTFEEGDENYARLLPLLSAAYADLAGECEDLLPQIFLPPQGAGADAPGGNEG